MIYLQWQKIIRQQYRKVKSLALCLAMPADFPDSGYYYRGKQREYDKEEARLKIMTTHSQFQRLMDKLSKQCEEARYNYFEKVQVVDEQGREWTASDMDRAMCYY